MPVEGLPSTLENMLCNLMKENMLQSWNIHGGRQVIVTLRFDSNGGQGIQASNVTYRKKPPSSIRRDKNRKVHSLIPQGTSLRM